MTRVVIDTNVVVSAVLSAKGKPAEIMESIYTERVNRSVFYLASYFAFKVKLSSRVIRFFHIGRDFIMIVFRLDQILKDFNMTQTELANRTGVRLATINGIYHGRTQKLRITYLDKICKALDCTTEDILEYIPDEEYEKLYKGHL